MVVQSVPDRGNAVACPGHPPVFAWDDAKGAKRFVESDQLRKSMQVSGVINPPELRFLDFYESFA